MENNEFQKVCIENHTCYYFDDKIEFEDFDFGNILLDEKSSENILIYDISYKTLIGAKPLCIRFNKVNGFNRVYGRSKSGSCLDLLCIQQSDAAGFCGNYAKFYFDTKLSPFWPISDAPQIFQIRPCVYLI